MPSFCAIVGCGNRGQRDAKSFFRLPAVITNQGEKTEELSRRRRCLWLSRIARDNLRDSTLPYIRVCSDHFVLGRPSALYDDANPDWAPSVNLGSDGMDEATTPTGGTQRRKRKRYRREKILEQVAASALLDLGGDAHEDNEENNKHSKSVKVQTDLTSESIIAMQMEIKRLMEENRTIRKDAAALKLNEFKFEFE